MAPRTSDLITWLRRWRGPADVAAADEAPLRAELYSVEQLEHHARTLAGWHRIDRRRGRDRLLARLADNESVLVRTHALVAGAAGANRRMAPAAEWLVDNFYLIEEQIRTARRHLPRGYASELPRVANGPYAGFPRVYAIAIELIAHVDGRVDARSLAAFVAAYQSVAALDLGELWAVPIMLRLALIENLRRVAAHIARGRRDRDLADDWADRLGQVAERSPADLVLAVADLARARLELTPAFIAEFARRLQGQSPSLALALGWVESRLAEHGAAIEQLVAADNQEQAADQVSIGHGIGSMRDLSSMDWREFVETASAVEQALRGDPAGVYGSCDFATRDRCRHEVERLARRGRLAEAEVAARVAALAVAAGEREPGRHVGWWLIGPGQARAERELRAWPRWPTRAARAFGRHPLLLYAGSISLASLAAGAWAGLALHAAGWPAWGAAAAGVAAALVGSAAAVSVANWLATLLAPPRLLPRLDFAAGIPSGFRTLVAVPAMLSDEPAIEELAERLEVHWLANRDPHLHVAALTDFSDAQQERMPHDDRLLARAAELVRALNAKYAAERGDIFLLLHRPRRWNERERSWMGWERKRGKLADLNALLRGRDGAAERFSLVVGDTSALPRVRLVITLDADTQLPRDSALRLAGTMAHPLNRPRFDQRRRVVSEGYAILQPRVGVGLPSAARSAFARLCAGDPGIDPYTRAVSDVYQDLFGEGSFIGKGIYDVDAFESVLAGRLPENRILSHDLLEGCYARAGLVSDVELYEDCPSRYLADAARRHRWVRGDWQIARWLLPRVPTAGGGERNPLSALARWKILDNLRRSLVRPAAVALIAAGWACGPGPAIAWTAAIAGAFIVPAVLPLLQGLIGGRGEHAALVHLLGLARAVGRQAAESALTLVMLPYEAWLDLDAVARTAVRLVARRRLLEWRTASESERDAATSVAGVARAMAPAPLIAAALFAAALARLPAGAAGAAVIAVPWLLSPAVAWLISRPSARRVSGLRDDDLAFLRRLARRTWRFFEAFVTAEDHWLPPDNYQEQPLAAIAHRTSPTNIGMAALAHLAAHDFGYLPTRRLVERLERMVVTLESLERYRGHLYNWYDTRSLKPLPPLYVSTVDSGNLAGHLLTLRQGLIALPRAVTGAAALRGIADTAAELEPRLAGEEREAVARLRAELADAPDEPSGRLAALRRAGDEAERIQAALAERGDDEARWWAAALVDCCRAHADDVAWLAPWTSPAVDPGTRAACEALDRPMALADVARLEHTAGEAPPDRSHDEARRLRRDAAGRAGSLITACERLAERIGELAEMDFTFLYDRARDLFAIGYNVSDHRLDGAYYDLLASEARLASYVAVAVGQIAQDHWWALGRLITAAGGERALLSWSGSMFEYLMPLLVMPTYEGTLLDQTYRAVVRRQMQYARRRGVPWGISESGYHLTDAHLNYQYRAFGVPGLGLKRGLGDDLVIAPYASAMALMVAPEAACRNLRRLSAEGKEGPYGLYEAIDYTPSRLPRSQSEAVVRSYMAHHQGMAFLAFAYLLLDRPMQRRFAAEPSLKTIDLLLHERVPRAAEPFFPHAAEAGGARRPGSDDAGELRVFTNPSPAPAEVHLLSNGRYHVMVNAAGAGYSRWRDLAVTRWREDSTRDDHGVFCYLRDLESGVWWSTTWQPSLKQPRHYEAIFSQARAEFRRHDEDIDLHVEISVSPEDDVEVRRVTATNRSERTRLIEFTTYAEVAIAAQAADVSHPAFSNLFVTTEILRPHGAVLCTRRARAPGERPPWLVHLLAGEGGDGTTWETDRAAFLGRCRTVSDPRALTGRDALTGAVGPVLDPIVAIRRVVRLPPDASLTLDIVTGMAETREGAEALAGKYRERRLADRVFELAWTHSQVVLRQLDASEPMAQLYARLAGSILYPSAHRRAAASVLARNRRGQAGLWGYGIGGDLPVVLVRMADPAKAELAREALRAHAWWRMKGLAVDLVFLVDDHSVYRQALHDLVVGLVAASPEAGLIDKPAGVFVRRAEQLPEEDRVLLQAVARIVLSDAAGTLAEQAERRPRPESLPPRLPPARARKADEPGELRRGDLVLTNGLGGFTRDGREYVIVLQPGQVTPAPWANVLANPHFGTVVSESGGAYTWLENSHEFRLTPWRCDPVSDEAGEALWLRDEEDGALWSPTPLPARGPGTYIIRHGFGYSVFEHASRGIASELWMYVAVDAPVKFLALTLRNRSGRARRLSATAYCEWVLGELRHKTAPHVVTELDAKSGALLARNPYNGDFPGRVAFLDCNEGVRSFTGDRAEFLGRNGRFAAPAGLSRLRLSGRVGAGLDPCAAIQAPIDLADGEERQVVFVLGIGQDIDDVQDLIRRFRGATAARRALEQVWAQWNRLLAAVYVETPDPAVNALVNGWLPYQALSCRMWARSGYYQSGGAFGFRDQLQDATALLLVDPGIAREHLLRAAARQFRDGDVQHWWHPPSGRGVRTRFSDDYLWLPWAACRYLASTGDAALLDERVPFLEGRPLAPEEEAYYDLPRISDEGGTLYEHCWRAIDHALARFGAHDLPLIGCGDWNDGMNLVGIHGKGESVWLAFFLHRVLEDFAGVATARGDAAAATRCREQAARLRAAGEQAWDGEWWRRAYFDDGTPLGSAQNAECRIDALPQAWAVLGGIGDEARARQAMASVDRLLVDRRARLIRLFDPPFDRSPLEPGYIKGYVPGVRENGGQYTHAALWTIMAFAELGDAERAWELFRLVNPAAHTASAKDIALYRVEPYVACADVYGAPPHVGRGGWTWYTGSAGWMYRLLVETLLGVHREGTRLRLAPRLPADWSGYTVHYRHRETFYHVAVKPVPAGASTRVVVDGVEQPDGAIELVDDRGHHQVEIGPADVPQEAT